MTPAKTFYKMGSANRQRLIALLRQHPGKSNAEIGAMASHMGILLTNGAPIKAASITAARRDARGGAPAPKTVPLTDARLPSTVVGILTDPGLSDTQKVRMCVAYGQV